jgi:hypothetical protein
MEANFKKCRHQQLFPYMEMGFQVFGNLQECLIKTNMIPVLLVAD